VDQAATELVELAKRRASDVLEAAVDDLTVSDGAVHVRGTDVSVTLARLAAAEPLRTETTFDSGAPTFPFGAHLAVVEVDVESGKASVQRIVTVDDAGPVLNPLLAEGQRHGGIAQGIAQALFEEVVFDDDGNPLTASFADYGFPSAAELPSFTLLDMETPTHLNPLGVKGIGEAGTIGATPAVQNAVVDAVAHLGVRHIDMPTTPLRVWEAIQAANAKEGS
jgi:carbon-monoxide dehydrogenase large subunit